MDKAAKIRKTVELKIAAASRELTAAKASITGAFDLGYDVEASQMEKLLEAQAEYRFWSSMVKLVGRIEDDARLVEKTDEKVEDLQETLLAQGANGSTSDISNGKAEIERKVLLRAYRSLSCLS